MTIECLDAITVKCFSHFLKKNNNDFGVIGLPKQGKKIEENRCLLPQVLRVTSGANANKIYSVRNRRLSSADYVNSSASDWC